MAVHKYFAVLFLVLFFLIRAAAMWPAVFISAACAPGNTSIRFEWCD